MDREKGIEEVLGATFDRMRDYLQKEVSPSDYERLRRDFIFHMTDWRSDLEKLAALYENPGSLKKKDASSIVVGFLYHVIPHLGAAGRLLLDDVGDPFGGDDVFGLLRKVAYWDVIEDCLVRFHDLKMSSARAKVKRYRKKIEEESSGHTDEPIDHTEPFHVACRLAGVEDADEQDRLLSLHTAEYRSICQFHGWQPSCLAGR
jgi:hypothetical protein